MISKPGVFIERGDITKIHVDAIVNAANSSLLGGSGVDGAIHKAAGSEMLKECQKIRDRQGGCKVGHAVITGSGNLPSRYVIHAVGPVWIGNPDKAKKLLADTYLSALEIANSRRLSSIAFPNISTGSYRFPKEIAAEIAVKTVCNYMKRETTLRHVIFVCFEEENYLIYRKTISSCP